MLRRAAQTSSSTSATRLVSGRETVSVALAERSLFLCHDLLHHVVFAPYIMNGPWFKRNKNGDGNTQYVCTKSGRDITIHHDTYYSYNSCNSTVTEYVIPQHGCNVFQLLLLHLISWLWRSCYFLHKHIIGESDYIIIEAVHTRRAL